MEQLGNPMLILPWLTFVDFVNLREASKAILRLLKTRDMLGIMRKRLPDILYPGNTECGETLIKFLKARNLLLSGSKALGLIFDEDYHGDIDLFYHNSINSDWNCVITPYIGGGPVTEFALMKIDEISHLPDVQIIRNMAHHSKLKQFSMHKIVTGGFDLSYAKNTVSFVGGVFTIEISDRNTLSKTGRLENHYNTTYKTIERIAKYKERGFHTEDSMSLSYTCRQHVHPAASMIMDLLPQEFEPYVHSTECFLTKREVATRKIPYILNPINGEPTCMLHNALTKQVFVNPAIGCMLNNA